jgi:sugar/nucleoside kinase (ribokinase family)
MTRPPDGPRLVHLGNAVVDLVVTVPHLPERGGDVVAYGATARVGGGFNVMAAALRHGLSVTYGGMHGSGQYAELVRAALRDEGVVVLQPPVPEVDTGVVLTFVDAGGERTFVTLPGAEAHLTPSALARVALRPGDLVYVTGYSLAHTINRAALTAWLPHVDPRVVVVVDPGPLVASLPPDALAVVLDRADWVTANLAEARVLTGADGATPAALALALARRAGRRGVVVRTGAEGCVLVEAGRGPVAGSPVTVPPVPVTVVDLNGAGDAHTGVLLAELARGADAGTAATRANAAAALAVTRPGPATAPTRRELDAFLDPSGRGARLPAHRA